MSSDLIFLDTETTGLELDCDIWELCAVRRHAGGGEEVLHLYIQHEQAKCDRLPDKFRTDHIARFRSDGALSRADAAAEIHAFIGGDRPHIVGANPAFDMVRIELLLAEHGLHPNWHYHLLDIETMAIGYLASQGRQITLPYSSDAVMHLLGIGDYPGRHTAAGDVAWAMAVWDEIGAVA